MEYLTQSRSADTHPVDAVMTIIANMDRLARQHPLYSERFVREQMPITENMKEYLYCAQDDNAVFPLILAAFGKVVQVLVMAL
jgi:hypothetical protein